MNKQIRILIVDDSTLNRWSMKLTCMLCSQINIVGEAANGDEAMQFLAHHPVDVVVTDVEMPEADGIELAEWIKQWQPHIKVVVTSSLVSYQQSALQAGADAFLPRDILHTQLPDAILTLGGRKSTAVASA